jgi:NAD(P)-dependent dehydrogenase (short-subunit alcohol dehydrogenase family)
MNGQAILIAGGYGVVGSRLAAKLAPDHPDRVVVACRSEDKATASAAEIGHGVRPRVLDVTLPSSIAAARTNGSTPRRERPVRPSCSEPGLSPASPT